MGYLNKKESRGIAERMQAYREHDLAILGTCKELIKDLKAIEDPSKFEDKELLNKKAGTDTSEHERMLNAVKRYGAELLDKFEQLEELIEQELKSLAPFFQKLKRLDIEAWSSFQVTLINYNEKKRLIYSEINRMAGPLFENLHRTMDILIADANDAAEGYKRDFDHFYKNVIEEESQDYGMILDRINFIIDKDLKVHFEDVGAFLDSLKDDSNARIFAANYYANNKTITRDLEKTSVFSRYDQKAWQAIEDSKEVKEFKENLERVVRRLFEGIQVSKSFLDNIFETKNRKEGGSHHEDVEEFEGGFEVDEDEKVGSKFGEWVQITNQQISVLMDFYNEDTQRLKPELEESFNEVKRIVIQNLKNMGINLEKIAEEQSWDEARRKDIKLQLKNLIQRWVNVRTTITKDEISGLIQATMYLVG